MREHWRLGLVERTVLEAFEQMGAGPDRPHTKSARVVDVLASEFGVSPRYGYATLCSLAQPWLQNIPLVDFHGNLGSSDGDEPAAPRYTEARSALAGVLALAGEGGTGPRLPIVLVNGNLHVDGLAPPFSLTRVAATIVAILDDPMLSDDAIVERVGPPESPTGCGMACDYRALGSGAPTGLVMTTRIDAEDSHDGPVLVLSRFPLGSGGYVVQQALAERVESTRRRERSIEPDDIYELGLPLREIRDESFGDTTRLVCVPPLHADLNECAAQIAATWGVTVRKQVQLPAPLPELMRELADQDPVSLHTALATLTAG